MVDTRCIPQRNPLWVAFVDQQVAVEEARKTSLESRGVATVTASGAVATVLLGLVTLTKRTGTGTLVVPGDARPWIEAALVLFFVAAFFALVTNVPVPLYWANPKELWPYIQKHWNAPAGATQQEMVDHQINRLRDLHRGNTLKGYALAAALVMQASAVLLIAIAVLKAF